MCLRAFVPGPRCSSVSEESPKSQGAKKLVMGGWYGRLLLCWAEEGSVLLPGGIIVRGHREIERISVFEGLGARERCAGWCAQHNPGLELRELKEESPGHRAREAAGGVRAVAVINTPQVTGHSMGAVSVDAAAVGGQRPTGATARSSAAMPAGQASTVERRLLMTTLGGPYEGKRRAAQQSSVASVSGDDERPARTRLVLLGEQIRVINVNQRPAHRWLGICIHAGPQCAALK